jgi:pimeloyl-ACP methyl ester carboxylesterase
VRVDEHTIYLDDSPVYYRSADASGMPTLYLHGIPTSSDDWLEFLARTGGIAPDLIGFGRSAKGGHLDYSVAGLATFLERLLAHLGVEEVQIVGHDWGAAVGLAFSRRNPDRVPRLVLCNAPPLGDPAAWPRILRLWRARGAGELIMGATTKRFLARTLRRATVRPDAWTDARVAAVWEQFDQGTQRAILRLVRSGVDDVVGGCGSRPPVGSDPRSPEGPDARPPADPDARPPADPNGRSPEGPHQRSPEGADARPPAGPGDEMSEGERVVLWGEQDPWYPPALADAYAAHLPGASVERIAGAGHWPWLDRPEVVDRVASLLAT